MNNRSFDSLSIVDIVRSSFRKSFDYRSRSPRKEFWIFELFSYCLALLFFLVVAFCISLTGDMNILALLIGGIACLICLALLVTKIALYCRRLHDLNLSGFWLSPFFLAYILFCAIGLNPVSEVVSILGLVFLGCFPSDKESNRYGPNPYEIIEKVEDYSVQGGLVSNSQISEYNCKPEQQTATSLCEPLQVTKNEEEQQINTSKTETETLPVRKSSSQLSYYDKKFLDDLKSDLSRKAKREIALYGQGNLASSPFVATNDESEDERYIRSFIAKNRLHCIYHFTARSNISSIKSRGGLFSWKYCVDNGIVYSGGGDELSKNLDKRKGHENYVRCSFCQDHPMRHRLTCEGIDTVLLEIDPAVLLLKGVLFSNINAVDNGAHIATGREGLGRIDFEATQRRYVSKEDPAFKPHQAEVLIPESIALQYIKNIDEV